MRVPIPSMLMAAFAVLAIPAPAKTFPIPAVGADAALATALSEAKAGDTLRFAAGRIPIAKTIVPKASGLILIGAGDTASTLVWQGAAGHMVFFNGVSGIEVRGLGFEGGANAKTGITAANGSGHVIRDARFADFKATEGLVVGIHFSSKAVGSLIADNAFAGMATECEFGGGIRVTGRSDGNRILRNRIENAGRGGIHVDGSRSNVIQGNVISGSGLSQGGANVGLGLEIWGGCDSSLIEDNRMDHWLSVDNSPFTAVRRNRIGTSGGTYKWAGLELVGSSHSVFTGNTVDDGAHIGISMSNKPAKDEVYWGFNTIRKASTWAMQMQGEEGGANRHFFYGNAFAGTVANHPQARYPNQGHGLRFNGAAYHIAFDSNSIADNQGAALDFHGPLDDFSFTRNAFTGNGKLANIAFPGKVLAFAGNTGSLAGAPAPVGEAKAPSSRFEAPAAAKAGDTVRFLNRSLAASGAAMGAGARVLWDFDDGLPSDRFDGSHAFERDGIYRVTLIVWDAEGQGARSDRWIRIGSGTSNRRTTGRAPVSATHPVRDGMGRALSSGHPAGVRVQFPSSHGVRRFPENPRSP